MPYSKILPFVFVFTLTVTSCLNKEQSGTTTTDVTAVTTVKDIHEVETFLGQAKGEELVKAHCITCHSLRYIQMQPEFPRKTWEKIVDKMVKTFGAPIPDSSAMSIVDYLVEVRGN